MPSKLDVRWQVDHIRVTVFASVPAVLHDSNWFNAIAGRAPDESISRPAAGEAVDSGTLAGVTVEVRSGIGRIDLIVKAANDSKSLSKYPLLGNYHDQADEYLPRACRWLSELKFPITRLAFGTSLLAPETDRISSYNTLSRVLPMLRIDAERMKELALQFNIPATCNSEAGLEINRIYHASCITVKSLPNIERPDIALQSVFTRLDLDINTAADNIRPLSDASATLVELRHHADAVYKEGFV